MSVLASFVWLLNLLQSLVLFFFAQVRVFDSETRECASAVVEKNSSFYWQDKVVLAHIALNYAKLLVLILAVLFFKCCFSGKFRRRRNLRRRPDLENQE